MEQKGEIQKRLDRNLCPWCTASLQVVEHEPLKRRCTQCNGIVVDHETKGETDGDDTRS